MNRSDVVNALIEATSLDKKEAEDVVDIILRTMTQALVDGERIEIRNFGRFMTKFYEARAGRNPRTGDQVLVPAKRLTHFKPGKELKDRIEAN